ncbi:hypothetical protein ELS19_16240 [Halogeometricum borinquense]|uniref:Uncharacterized protein n=1 Tax=Halogeometricum borinquense TaxID=60847 RepID=A0A482SZW5_9EURY|nr:hypothetical protein ELS19_16240 [Halogeometricum borinquense]
MGVQRPISQSVRNGYRLEGTGESLSRGIVLEPRDFDVDDTLHVSETKRPKRGPPAAEHRHPNEWKYQ